MNDQIHPFQNAIESLVGALPLMTGADNFPLAQRLENVIYSDELDEDTASKLYDYCCLHAKPEWATGYSMIAAADLIVQNAFDNANLKIREIKGKNVVVFVNG